MSRIIILEGPDGVGKSTLAKRLTSEHLIVHGGGPVKDMAGVEQRCQNMIDHARVPNSRVYVYDRHTMISELVYGKVLRGESLVNIDQSIEFFWNVRPTIVFLFPGKSDLALRMKENAISLAKEKAHKSQAHTESVVQNYDRLVKAYGDIATIIITSYSPALIVDPLDEPTIQQLVKAVGDHKHVRLTGGI